MKKYILITSFIFVFVLGGAFMLSSKNAGAQTTVAITTKTVATAPSNIIAWTGSSGATSDLQVFKQGDLINPVLSRTGLTVTSFNLSGLLPIGNYFWQVRGVNSFGKSQYSTPVPIGILIPGVVTAIVPPVPSTVFGYDFISTDSKLALLTNVVTARAKVIALLPVDKARNATLVATYNTAKVKILALKANNNTANANSAAIALIAFNTADIAATNAVTALNVALNNLDVAVKAMTGPINSGNSDFVTLDGPNNLITIGGTANTSVFAPINRFPIVCPPNCFDVADTVTISGDTIIVGSGSAIATQDPVSEAGANCPTGPGWSTSTVANCLMKFVVFNAGWAIR